MQFSMNPKRSKNMKVIGTKWKPQMATGLRYDAIIRRGNNEAHALNGL